jgi:hypothetical protein
VFFSGDPAIFGVVDVEVAGSLATSEDDAIRVQREK